MIHPKNEFMINFNREIHNVDENKKVSVLILAAGISRRMNTPKLFLPFDKNTTFIEKIISTYRNFGCAEIVIVVNKNVAGKLKNLENITIVINEKLEFERFYSVKLGLQKMEDCDFCFLQDTDNPFITADILNYIFSENLPDKYIIPSFNGRGGHPILLPKKIIEKLKNNKKNDVNLKKILSPFISFKLEIPNQKILININNPQDYKKYFNFKK